LLQNRFRSSGTSYVAATLNCLEPEARPMEFIPSLLDEDEIPFAYAAMAGISAIL
jgi:hypothetical protein